MVWFLFVRKHQGALHVDFSSQKWWHVASKISKQNIPKSWEGISHVAVHDSPRRLQIKSALEVTKFQHRYTHRPSNSALTAVRSLTPRIMRSSIWSTLQTWSKHPKTNECADWTLHSGIMMYYVIWICQQSGAITGWSALLGLQLNLWNTFSKQQLRWVCLFVSWNLTLSLHTEGCLSEWLCVEPQSLWIWMSGEKHCTGCTRRENYLVFPHVSTIIIFIWL